MNGWVKYSFLLLLLTIQFWRYLVLIDWFFPKTGTGIHTGVLDRPDKSWIIHTLVFLRINWGKHFAFSSFKWVLHRHTHWKIVVVHKHTLTDRQIFCTHSHTHTHTHINYFSRTGKQAFHKIFHHTNRHFNSSCFSLRHTGYIQACRQADRQTKTGRQATHCILSSNSRIVI